MINFRCPQSIPAVNKDHFLRHRQKVQGFRRRGIPAAYHGNGFPLIKGAVAGCAVADSPANQGLLHRQVQLPWLRSGGINHRSSIKGALTGFRRLWLCAQVQGQYLRKYRLGTKPLRLALHPGSQREAVDSLRKARVVVDLLRQRHLSSGRQLFQNQDGQPRPGGVQRRGESCRAAADDQHIIDFHFPHHSPERVSAPPRERKAPPCFLLQYAPAFEFLS